MPKISYLFVDLMVRCIVEFVGDVENDSYRINCSRTFNLGDEAILSCNLEMLRKAGKGDLVVISPCQKAQVGVIGLSVNQISTC